MTVEDGSSNQELCGIYEGLNVPNMIVSSSNELKVKFESNSGTHMEGFAATLIQGMYIPSITLQKKRLMA